MLTKASGFTLVEILIALAILAIALSAIYQSIAQASQTTAYLENKTIAHWVGLQIINEASVGLLVLPQAPLTEKETTIMLGRNWDWQAWQANTANSQLTQINVTVNCAQSSTVLAHLTRDKYGHA